MKTSQGVTIEEAREHFQQWRNGRSGKARIPDELWAMAIELARRSGVNATAQELHLDGGKLKRLLMAAVSGKTAAASPPTFVELVAPQSARTRDAVVEFEGPRGATIRIQLHGATMAELVELSRALSGLA